MNNRKLVIRAYEASDKQRLSSIWYRASLEAHAFLGIDRLREQQKLIEDVYLEKAETWVAHLDGEAVGFIGLLDTFVGGLFVDPTVQGSGIGRALIAHALMLKEELSLEVYADNKGAYGFYERLGFKELSRRLEDDNGLPFENVRMHLTRDPGTDHAKQDTES